MAGKHLDLFLVDGSPGGLTTAEITNWTGHVVTAPRSKLAELLVREELRRTGAYLLLGDDPDAVGGIRLYVGEADEIRTRLREHNRSKDYWERVVVITSKDANLTKSHGRYLEARLIALASQAGRCHVENGTNPPLPALPEADVSDMDYFLDELKIVLPMLGVNVLRSRSTVVDQPKPVSSRVTSPEFHLSVPRRSIAGRAVQVDGEFTILKDSVGATAVRTGEFATSTANAYRAYQTLHDKLIADGSLEIQDGHARFTRDVVFTSPSTAGAVLTGRSCNGRKQWLTAEGISFGAWEQQGVDDVSHPGG